MEQIENVRLKRFLVFGYFQYYPSGGLGDVDETFDTNEEAVAYAKTVAYDFVEVWDRIADETTYSNNGN